MLSKLLSASKIIISLLVLLIISAVSATASDQPVTLEFFWAEGCPHCAKEKLFLQTLPSKYPLLEVKSYEISQNLTNSLLLQKRGRDLNADVSGVPFTIVGNQYVVGFGTAETTGKQIENLINRQMSISNQPVDPLVSPTPIPFISPQPLPDMITIPLIGNLSPKDLSLPVLTFVIALMDGFNPCAMWTLLFLISLLLGMKNKKRMWLLGTAFIITSALVYFLFLSAWLNLFLFLGLIFWVRLVIAAVALTAGIVSLRSYLSRETGCQVMGNSRRQAVFAKLRVIATNPHFAIALGGIILLAVAVNLVELICSAGLPAVYTQVLSLSALSTWHYYLYLLLYVFIFMLDDLFIFFTAMITLQAVGIQSKYSKISKLIGGLLMLAIGLLLLFKPEWLMFG